MHKLSCMSAGALLVSAAGWMAIQAADKVDAKSLRTAKRLLPTPRH
jgi:hypothetical protein